VPGSHITATCMLGVGVMVLVVHVSSTAPHIGLRSRASPPGPRPYRICSEGGGGDGPRQHLSWLLWCHMSANGYRRCISNTPTRCHLPADRRRRPAARHYTCKEDATLCVRERERGSRFRFKLLHETVVLRSRQLLRSWRSLSLQGHRRSQRVAGASAIPQPCSAPPACRCR
jgi:hypothetical protein